MADPALPDPASLETARPGPDGPRARPRRVPSLPTVLASAACFLVVFEFLAFQLRSGRDPAIGASAGASRRRPDPARSSSTGGSSSAGSSSRAQTSRASRSAAARPRAVPRAPHRLHLSRRSPHLHPLPPR